MRALGGNPGLLVKLVSQKCVEMWKSCFSETFPWVLIDWSFCFPTCLCVSILHPPISVKWLHMFYQIAEKCRYVYVYTYSNIDLSYYRHNFMNSSCQGALFPNHVFRYRINSTLPNTGGYFLPRLGWLENLNGFLVSSWTLHRVKA